jgi:ATP/maltotriose-dependent transcriptional regulator MalT/DNA-binding SARP family transcriptional activator
MPLIAAKLRSKLTPPSLRGVIERPALLAQLAALAPCSVWLTAPSGAGKSTLVADYVAHEAPQALWYRLDGDDTDPGYFFPTLSTALQQRFGLAPLPSFSDAYRGEEKAFVELFGNTLLAQLERPVLLVFDDARHATRAPLDRLLTQLVLVTGPLLRCIFIADVPPTPAFFDAIMRRQLMMANDLDLRFSVADCEAAARQVRVAHLSGVELHALTGGHAGALVLACELLRAARPAAAGTARRDGSPIEQMHAYLLHKLLDDLPGPQRDLLLHTSPMPRLAAPLVDEVLTIEHSDEQLEALADRGLLIRYPNGADLVYEAHTLVRRGARLIAERALGAATMARMTERCAQVLQANALLEDAYALWLELGQIDTAVAVLTALAQRYARAGQAGLLLAAIDQLPAGRAEAEPQIALWTALAVTSTDELQARRWGEIAYAGYAARGDRTGMAVAAATVLTAYFYFSYFGDFQRLDLWLERMAAHRNAGEQAPAPWRGMVLMGVLSEFSLSEADRASTIDSAVIIDALRGLVLEPAAWPSADQQLVAARLLFESVANFQSQSAAQEIVLATEPLAQDPSRSPALRAHWITSAIVRLPDVLDEALLSRYVKALDALVSECGLPSIRLRSLSVHALLCLHAGRADEAAALLPAIEALAVTAVPTEQANLLRLWARILMAQSRMVEALPFAQRARAAASRAGLSARVACVYTEVLAYALAANGRYDEAWTQMASLPPLLTARQKLATQALADLLGYLAQPAARSDLLAQGFTAARTVQAYGLMRPLPQLLAELCAQALAADIEPEFVRRLIERRRLVPPPLAGPKWPWRIRIRLLGDFQLEIEDQHYRPQRKAQEKPLELLKLLACRRLDAPAGSDKLWLEERLWPGAAPEAARKSLDMTVTRLRRLLNSEDALEVSEGRVRLAPEQVWTDIDCLAQAAQLIQAEHDRRVAQRAVNGSVVVQALTQLLTHYRGAVLAGEEGDAWLLGLQHRAAGLFRLAVLQADELSGGHEGREPITALERALVAEPLAEELVRALMQRHLARGDQAAALQVYQRYRELLHKSLEVGPSAAMELLRQSMGHTVPADSAV